MLSHYKVWVIFLLEGGYLLFDLCVVCMNQIFHTTPFEFQATPHGATTPSLKTVVINSISPFSSQSLKHLVHVTYRINDLQHPANLSHQ